MNKIRKGDEIVICGQYFHTGAPVVLWTDPGGYDAYRTERRRRMPFSLLKILQGGLELGDERFVEQHELRRRHELDRELDRFHFRLLAAALFVLLLFGLLAARLVHLQVFRHDELATQAEANRITSI